ncbi:MAG: ABC transporter permease [Anaerolineales bacterium]|jgi:peptide/nickel transport system permease protein|uniref:ABC transporter permease n=1 Tax=Candidatus Villigracilis affinis TaxID=3140682 RepID=UPI001DA4E8E2|nr:ABC transporter permease [Anaerolineales bacterium]MBK9602918.1 ABC transporter permease [Anaerolineales bacterium]MBL0346089.1 ABC transporter permease [Anaerolineales bacterium]
MNNLRSSLSKLFQYPSAVAGIFVVLALIVVAAYAMITIPYSEAIRLWRGGEEVWYQNPRFAAPAWINYFSNQKYSESFAVNTTDGQVTKTVTPGSEGVSTIDMSYEFDYSYDVYPQELILYLKAAYNEKQPFVSVELLTPDNRTIRIGNFSVGNEFTYRFSQDEKLRTKLRTEEVIPALFSLPDSNQPLKGKYTLIIQGTTFEPDSDLSVEFVSHGQVFGWAGTDHARRDLVLPLLWGVPVALAFGLIASMGTSILTMIIAAVGAWYTGWVDELIQRITEVNLVLPFYALLIMIGTFYSRSIWVILGATIILSIFTGSIKAYRAIFIQVKESMYIEAAKAYGASSPRIIFLYLIPRMIPLLIPSLVQSVPAFVFLEASLAVIGLGDPVLPTWGKIIQDANSNGALYKGYYYWVLEPAMLLMITGLAFAFLGFALDRVFNPKLRDV